MIRKLTLSSLAVALSVTVLTTVGTGIASGSSHRVSPSAPVTFVGNVSCNFAGSITINPPATNTSGGPYTVSFAGKTAGCVGLPGTTLTQSGVTLRHGIQAYTYAVPASGPGDLCDALEYGALSPNTTNFVIAWSGRITPTTVTFSSSSIIPGFFLFSGGVTTGSFPGSANLLIGYSLVKVATDCAVAGPGVSHLTENDLSGDNLELGPAF
jgi:hypothetical protein